MKAPPFPQKLEWFNSDKPLNIDDLKGHVVLLDFWTSCCINCMHTLKDLEYLEEKYKDEPVLIIGIHSPKFYNEKHNQNIISAIDRYEITHPVVSDVNHEIWQSYTIHAWPTFVLIGTKGKIILAISGEGKRDLLDNSIKQELDKSKKDNTLSKDRIMIKREKRTTSSILKYPAKIAFNEDTNSVFISDSNHNRIIHAILDENKPIQANIQDIIGNGDRGLVDGDYKETAFFRPQGLTYHKGFLYVCDTENHSIRAIDLTDRKVKTLSGNGRQGYFNTSAEEGLLNSPWDCIIKDDYLYVAMAGCHQIWRMELNSNHMEPYVGNGYEHIIDGVFSNSSLAQPSGISANDDSLYFTDSESSSLRMCNISTGKVKTLIGSGLFDFGFTDGKFNEASLQHPLGLCYKDRMVFIADSYNHAIRMANLNEGKIYTVIHPVDNNLCSINGKECDVLPLYEPNDIKVYRGKLFIMDTNNHLIRVYNPETATLETLQLK